MSATSAPTAPVRGEAATTPAAAQRTGRGDTRGGPPGGIGVYFGLLVAGLVCAAFSGAALSWDGGGILFQALDTRSPVVPHQRWINIPAQAPALLLSGFSDNLGAIGAVYGLTWGGFTLAALLACWYIVREVDPALFVWPALGIGLGLLPGSFNLTAEANIALILVWPLVLAALVGQRREHLAIVAVFAALLAISHPYAILLFAMLATLVAFIRWRARTGHHRPGRNWVAIWAVLAGVTLVRFVIFRTGYESEQLSWGILRWNFTVSLAGLPALALTCIAATAVAVFVAPFVARRGWRGMTLALRAVRLAGLLASAALLLGWARDAQRWQEANKYTYPALLVTGAFVALATLDRAWSPPGGFGVGRDWSSRLQTMQLIGLTGALVLATQGVAWFSLTEQLRRTVATNPWNCISTAPLGWLQGTPLDQFATPSYALLLQGRTPERAVLYGNGCDQDVSATGIALNQYYVRPWERGWFDLRPLRARIAAEQRGAGDCSFQFAGGWYDTEPSDPYWWRWTDGQSSRLRIVVDGDRQVTLNGQIESSGPPDDIAVAVNGTPVATVAVAERGLQTFRPLTLALRSGANEIELRGGNPARLVGGRLLAFNVANLTLTASDTGRICRFHP